MQVSAHKRAVSLFERYAKAGDNIKLKDWGKRRFCTFSIILRWRICWTTERSSRPGAILENPTHSINVRAGSRTVAERISVLVVHCALQHILDCP